MKKPVLLVTFLIMMSFPNSLAHVPGFAGDNEEIESAQIVENPAKSWAIYGEIHGDHVQYYALNFSTDDRIELDLLVSTDPSDQFFLPSLILMGPGLASENEIPRGVEVPDGYGWVLAEGEKPSDAKYEGFSPSSYYRVVDLSLRAPEDGRYFVAVYPEGGGGKYSLVIGYLESFSVQEWVLIPIRLVEVYRWGGQNLLQVFAPVALIVFLGSVFFFRRTVGAGGLLGIRRFLVVLSGLMFVGSGFNVLYQMIYNLTRVPLTGEIAITLVLGFIPLILGVGVIRMGMGMGRTEIYDRLKLVFLSILGLLVWAGVVIGPVILLISGILPSRGGEGTNRDLGSDR